jgi:hypothetical protein
MKVNRYMKSASGYAARDQLDVNVHGPAEGVRELRPGSVNPSRAPACGSPVRPQKRKQPDVEWFIGGDQRSWGAPRPGTKPVK